MQLRGGAVRLRRLDARGKPAVHRTFCRRSDSAPACEGSRRDGVGQRCGQWGWLISSHQSQPELGLSGMDLAIRLAADVGGTFTDVAAFDESTGELRLGKTLTTPSRLVTGVEAAVT